MNTHPISESCPSHQLPSNAREKAFVNFSKLLLNAQIKPGQFLTQKEIVAMTDMSLATVRELIPRLEADGLIQTIPNRGLQVLHIDLKLIENAFELRLILERRAVAHYCDTASNEQIETIINKHKQVLKEAESGTDRRVLKHAQKVDWDFHDAMICALDNEIIWSVYRVNSIKIRLIVNNKTRINAHNLKRVYGEHLKILHALLQRDKPAAIKAMEEHILSAKRNTFSPY